MPEQETNTKKDKDKDVLPYLSKLKELKSIHPSIQISIEKWIRVLEEAQGPIKENMNSVMDSKKQIDEELIDANFGDIYPDSNLNKIFPLYEQAQKNFNTRQGKQAINLSEFIIELVTICDGIKEKIVEVPAFQEEPIKSESEKKAFENKQRQDIKNLKDKVSNKAHFNLTRNKILKLAQTKEEKMITDNIALDIFGKKLEDVPWDIGKRKK